MIGFKSFRVVMVALLFLSVLPICSFISPIAAAQDPTQTSSVTVSPTEAVPTLKTPPPTPSPNPTSKNTKTPTPNSTPTPIPTIQPFKAPPTLSASAAIAVDVDTGRILYAKNPYLSLPEASTTKITTALTLLSIPGVSINDYTIVQRGDLIGEANMDLHTGMRIKIVDLLYGLLLDSANDAAMALARYGGSKLPGSGDEVDKFVAEMNQEAGQLGLWNTHFQNPHGLDEVGHYTSVQDLAIAGWYALQNPVISTIVRQNAGQLDGFWFANISNFIRRYPGATGIKPGQTDEAGLCLVASASRFGHNIIVVELNNPKLATESDLLMDYAFSLLVGQDQSQGLNVSNVFANLLPDVAYIGYPTADKHLSPTLQITTMGFAHGLITELHSTFASVLVLDEH